jgi:hypothetical protein
MIALDRQRRPALFAEDASNAELKEHFDEDC